MLNKAFLLLQYDDWTRHLTRLSAQLEAVDSRDRAAAQERVGKATEWLAHYARLLRDGHGVEVPGSPGRASSRREPVR